MSGARLGRSSRSGSGVVVVRRRSLAVGLVTAQALLLAGASRSARAARSTLRSPRRRSSCAASLLAGAAPLPRPAHARGAARARRRRAARARRPRPSALALALIWLSRRSASTRPAAERGDARARRDRARRPPRRGARRSSRCSGSCSSRTGSRSPRSRCRARSSLAIELGVAFDLLLIAVVAGVFHERIFAEFGAGDTAALRSLRDS